MNAIHGAAIFVEEKELNTVFDDVEATITSSTYKLVSLFYGSTTESSEVCIFLVTDPAADIWLLVLAFLYKLLREVEAVSIYYYLNGQKTEDTHPVFDHPHLRIVSSKVFNPEIVVNLILR